MSISSVKEIDICKGESPWELPCLGIRRWQIFSHGDEDRGENPSKDVWGWGTVFYPSPCRDFLLENFIKITFINIYLSTL
jgi:hypothetical protein